MVTSFDHIDVKAQNFSSICMQFQNPDGWNYVDQVDENTWAEPLEFFAPSVA